VIAHLKKMSDEDLNRLVGELMTSRRDVVDEDLFAELTNVKRASPTLRRLVLDSKSDLFPEHRIRWLFPLRKEPFEV
jgi:hypothetical protein